VPASAPVPSGSTVTAAGPRSTPPATDPVTLNGHVPPDTVCGHECEFVHLHSPSDLLLKSLLFSAAYDLSGISCRPEHESKLRGHPVVPTGGRPRLALSGNRGSKRVSLPIGLGAFLAQMMARSPWFKQLHGVWSSLRESSRVESLGRGHLMAGLEGDG